MTTDVLFTIPKNYLWTIASVALMAFHYLTVSLMVAATRRKIFSKEFLNAKFGEDHKAAYGCEPPVGGFPDNGEGRFAKALPRDEWLDLKNAMRGQQNYKELLPIFMGTYLLCGLFHPILAAVLCLVGTIGRGAYAFGYKKGGFAGRVFGAYSSGVPMTLTLLYVIVRGVIGFF
jgi:hypothetical protein